MTGFDQHLEALRGQIEARLADCFQNAEPRARLYDAMRYSLLSGGKRIRPVLALESCRICGGEPEAALPLACAVEMVHTYSLIHDDLPCMDDDDLRRGRPANHKVYGEAAALLAGDGLLTAAFGLTADSALPAHRTVEAVACLARAAGAGGMVGGQALDLAAQGDREVSGERLHQIHRLKTGALIGCAVQMGCIAAGAEERDREAMDIYAQRLGLAFQIRDDMLDVEGEVGAFGKPIGSDAAQGKRTFADLLGLEGCRREVDRLTREAVSALERFPQRGFLVQLALRLAGRDR